jgi:ADP-ribosylglycohydrolase
MHQRILRAQGCLAGQIAGDALGSLVEFQPPSWIAKRYVDGPRRLEQGGTWNTLAGQPTDDSEMAITLARSLVRFGRYDEEAVARAYAAWLDSSPFDVGATTRQALSAASRARGQGVAAAARQAANQHSQANGSLMRISPLGIFGWRVPNLELSALARTDATLTHPNVVCRDAAALFTCAVAFAVEEFRSPFEIYQRVLDAAGEIGANEAVVACLLEAARRPPADMAGKQQGWVLIALQNAFYRLLHSTTLEEGVVETVRSGGDTDTNAAITGALMGACYGVGAIPCQWLEVMLRCQPAYGQPDVLRPRPAEYWPCDLLELATKLLVVHTP